MRDFKSSLLLLVSLLLVISLGLLATAFYHFYFKIVVYKPVTELTSRDRIIITSGKRDSLQHFNTAVINELGNRLELMRHDADSFNINLDGKLTEFYKLRNELSVLKDGNSNAGVLLANQKITTLQQKIEALNFANSALDKENARLNAIIKELKSNETPAEEEVPGKKKTTTNFRNASPENFVISELHLSAIRVVENKEKETNIAGETNKLVVSLNVYNNNTEFYDAQIIVIVIQPDGRVLQGSTRESGGRKTLQSKKLYTSKIRFNYKRGERKKLQFSLNVNNYQQGNYTIQVYRKGVLLAKMNKILL